MFYISLPLKVVLLCVSGDCSTPPLEGIHPAFAEQSAFSPPEEIIHASSLKIGPPVPGNNSSLNGALTDRQIFLWHATSERHASVSPEKVKNLFRLPTLKGFQI